jgi:hypothetical protein
MADNPERETIESAEAFPSDELLDLNDDSNLTAEEMAELSGCAPGEDDVVDGVASRTRIADRLTELLPRHREFRDMQHLKEFCLAFASMWGFHLNIHGTTHLVCARNDKSDSRKKNTRYIPASPGSMRTVKNAAKVGCTFKITATFVASKNRKVDRRVKITKSCQFIHSDLCCPGVMSQVVARRNSGFYAKKFLNPEKLRTVLEMLDNGCTEPRVLRRMLKQYIPANNPLKAIDLYNFRMRAKITLANKSDEEMGDHKCLCIEESFDAYEWILRSMLVMAGMDKSVIKVLFGDRYMEATRLPS